MKKFILAACSVVLVLFAGYYAYYHLGVYIGPDSDTPVTTFMKTDEDTIYMERGGAFVPFEIRGVNMGVGIPGHFATDYAIDQETYLRWFGQIQDLGANTVRSLLSLDYKLYEIIVVDDGSTDDTAQVMREVFRMYRVNRPIQRRIPCQPEESIYETQEWNVPITLVSKRNGGKADALNMGINVSRYPYFLCIDADSVLQHDSLEKIVRPVLEDSSVVAVGGTVRPCNGAEIENGRVVRYRMPRGLLACMQVLEYDRSFLASRILFDKFNGNIIISGAFGLFLKSVVVAAGGYDPSTMGEDMELVVKLHVFCRENGRPTASAMSQTQSAGPRCPSGWEICAGSGGAGTSACSKA